MSDNEFLEQISKKLSALIAFSLTKDTKKMTAADYVKILVRFGLSNQDIANIVGTTKQTVEVLKSRIKKRKGKK